MSSILVFSSPQQPIVEQVGNKAYELIRMAKKGYPVPPGFVLTVSFFEPWTEAMRAAPEWHALINGGPEALGRLAQASKEKCETLRFSPSQKEALEKTLISFHAANPSRLFAVRSSSPEEDLEGFSFAGAYKTTLGVTPDKLEDAIRHTFASSFDERTFLYKIQQGIQIAQPRIAVIIQKQIDAQIAGVAFSINPVNNCYDEAVINANFGLGESVVSGEVDPDAFVVDKVNRKLIDFTIGSKECMITLDPGGGTVNSQRDSDTEACITPAQVDQIIELISQIEVDYQAPVDIEWAYVDERLYLLQVRPITTYLPLPEEMITAPGEPKRLYADSTLIEQGVQEPLSVLGTDFIRYVLNTMTGPMGENADGVDGGAFTAGGRYYINLSRSMQMIGRAGPLAPGSFGDQSVMEILESIDVDEYLHEKPSLAEMIKRISGPLKIVPLLLPAVIALWKPDRILKKFHQALPGQMIRIENVMERQLSMHELASQLTGLLHFFFYEYGLPMIFAPQFAHHRIKNLFKDDGEQVKEHLLSLGTSLPGNKTSEMGILMSRLANSGAIKGHSSYQSFHRHLELRSFDPEFIKMWDEFIAEFGARCPKEIDVATQRVNEDPAKLFEQLKSLSTPLEQSADSTSTFEEARLKREAAFNELHKLAKAKGQRRVRTLERMYKTWLTLGGYRETPKHFVIKVVDLFRKRALQVGDAFVEAGRLDNPNQIFNLTIEDIDRATAVSAIDLREIADERTMLINKLKRSHHVARIIDSRGKIFFPPRKAVKAGELTGIPISAGVVTGRVKILHSAGEKPVFQGEILVTRATDPGWTPLFINAGGIVLEIGGALQHGAVVAREYGLPCVSGVDRASDLLKDGQLVEVDGSRGVVRIIDE